MVNIQWVPTKMSVLQSIRLKNGNFFGTPCSIMVPKIFRKTINDLMTENMVFVEQPLALPGSAHILASTVLYY